MRLTKYLKLARPPLLLLSIFASLGIMRYYGTLDGLKSIIIFSAIVFGNIGYNILNDVMDRDTDAVLKPWKPIPSGEVPLDTARDIAFFFIFMSMYFVIMLAFYDIHLFLIGLVGIVGGVLYNYYRLRAVVGNLVLGATYFSAAYLCSFPRGLDFALAFALITVSFNIAVQIQDVDGDRLVGLKTLPSVLGVQKARIVAVVLGLCAIYLLSRISTLFAWTFVVSEASVIISLALNRKETYEVLVRWVSRFTMMLGYLLMLGGV